MPLCDQHIGMVLKKDTAKFEYPQLLFSKKTFQLGCLLLLDYFLR